MNETVNSFLLAGDKFMPEMHSRQPGFTYSAFETFTKKKEYKILRNRKFTIYLSKRTRACFQHDMSIIFLIGKAFGRPNENEIMPNKELAEKITKTNY